MPVGGIGSFYCFCIYPRHYWRTSIPGGKSVTLRRRLARFIGCGMTSLLLLAMSVFAAVPSRAATPGGIFLTGHDPDFHSVGGNTTGAQHIIQRAVSFVTSGIASPRLLLVTDVHSPGSGYIDPRLGMNAAGFSGYDVADDGTGGGAIKDLHTVNFSNYDVVVVASDYGGWLRQAELDILNARSSAIISFINGGGGLVAFAESGGGGQNLTTHNRFGFLPFVVSSTPLSQSETANTLTPFGTSLGLVNSDINGNFSHNVFTKTGPLQIVDVDPTNEILSAAERGLVVPSVDTSLTATSGQSGTSITIPIGSSVVDAATLMGATPDAGGSVGFVVYSDSGCTTAIASGGSVTVVNGSVRPSNPVAFNTFGTFYWVAGYSGDSKNIANASACGGETVTVVKATPSVSTTPSGSVPPGGSVSDSATLTGGFSPSGSVTFQLFAPGDTTCAGPAFSTTSGTLTGGTASSGSVTVGTAGTYNWVASYAGDANNDSATSSCG